MNVYDFDKTIYDGDSMFHFYFYCLKKKPQIILCVFRQMKGALLYLLHKTDIKGMKEHFYCYLQKIDNASALVEAFWDENEKGIKKWYLDIKTEGDLIISASPYFTIKPICDRLGISDPIATDMDIATGKINGKNCKGDEKVKRFYEKYPEEKIKLFYSDSFSDTPLARIAEKAYLVKGDKLTEWPVE